MNIFKNKSPKILTLISVVSLIFAPNVYGLEISINGNGESSDNSAEIILSSQTTVVQENNLQTSNNVDTGAVTGENSISLDSGSNTYIKTGDINEQVSIENSVNLSSLENSCCSGSSEINIGNNGSDSLNSVGFSQTETNLIVENNNALIQNNSSGNAKTGENSINSSTSGSVSINTGDINISGKINNNPINLSSINSSSGIYGIFTSITGNGSASENIINANLINETSIFQIFLTKLSNSSNWNLNTGKNDVDGNTNGNIRIETGNINFNLFINNLVNIGNVNINCCEAEIPHGDGEGNDGDGNENESQSSSSNTGGGGVSSGQILTSAAATEAGGPGIVGLSDTKSDKAQTLIFFIGLFMIAFGIKMIGEYFASEKIK